MPGIIFQDLETGLGFPSASAQPFEPHYTPSGDQLEEALKPMILSASGWRKIFAADGQEESRYEGVSAPDKVLCAGMAWTFFTYLTQTLKISQPRIALGIDSRFTGPGMADVMLRLLVTQGARVSYLGIVSAPEIMGWVQIAGEADGFLYISASHNPAGHNGVKFGLSDGGVLEGAQTARMITVFRESLADPAQVSSWIEAVERADEAAVASLLKAIPSVRERSRAGYRRLCHEILGLESAGETQKARLDDLRAQIARRGLGVVAEFNGSARTTSIDRAYLEDLGVQVLALNDKPREIVHRIVPEGESLNLCRDELETAHGRDPRFVLGYVPDCDGDRGNLVWYDEKASRARILEAQEVFALCVLSELAGLVYYGQLTYDEDGQPNERIAVVCNDPTSLRIDRIAGAFGARVFRAEVGEANVVNLARSLRVQGWTVRILGEGSNGGNITHPGAVRDPLSTVGSLLKLLCVQGTADQPGLFPLWCQRIHQVCPPGFSLADIVATLPAFTTTSAFEDRALLKIRSSFHGALKAAYEKLFLTTGWRKMQDELRENLGIWAWEEINYEGMEERRGFGAPFRSGRETGGFKILLKDQQGEPVGFLWMRGSGTEPVFRVMVDIEGCDPEKEKKLLDWHVSMIRAVDLHP